jgi:3-oxoacyl-[acyl-carrier protein] reductase
MELNQARILITGGSSGIGKATAKLLIERGSRVAISGRDRAKLTRVAQEIGAIALPYDASLESDIMAMYAELDRIWGGLDVLVNNAGIGFFGPMDEVAWSDFEQIFHTNVFGGGSRSRATHEAAKQGQHHKHCLKRGSSRIQKRNRLCRVKICPARHDRMLARGTSPLQH